MTRENVEGMVLTELVTHNARYGMPLIQPLVLATRIADAILAQQEREAQASVDNLRTIVGDEVDSREITGS